VSGRRVRGFKVSGARLQACLRRNLGLGTLNLASLISFVALAPAVASCSWFTDFKDQPKLEPWESVSDSVPPRGNPQYSVPLQGSVAPGFLVSRQPLPATIDSMAGLTNPVVADARSLDNGRKLYQINCAVCHGANGVGAGPAVRYGMAGIGLVNDRVRGLSDGYIWGMIRNGRGLMPSYNRIEELERWDVVNYVRGLQGRFQVDTTMALPGVTGNALPGASRAAPTRPAPFFNSARPPSAGRAPAGAPQVRAPDSLSGHADTTASGGRRP
jgi:mono/diheme cytochrome c family protein